MKKVLFFLTLLLAAAFTHAQTIVFSEDFDLPSGPDKVITTATGDSLFGINTRLHYSGTQCDTANPPFNSISYLTTLPFSTVGQTNVLLKFAHICKVEIFDTAKVEVSVDGGATWVRLNSQYINPGNSQFASQSYRFCSSTYSDNIWQATVDSAKPKQNWWRNEVFDISVLAANKADVRVRFVLRGNANFDANRGWYLDDILVIAGTSELLPPQITMIAPIVQDTVFSTGPFDIFADIIDASGIDTAYIVYQLNGGANQYIPMLWVSGNTYKGTIPSYTYNNRIDYHVYAADNSSTHNPANGPNQWFYIKHGPSLVQIGTATTNQRQPFGYYFGYERSASIYSSSEINMSGVVNNLQWYVATAQATSCPTKIYLKTTTASTFATAETWANLIAGATLVYDGTTNFSTVGWKTFIPTASFNYSSGNLMVLCETNYSGSGTTPYAYFQYTATTGNNTHQQFAQDDNAPTGTGSLNTNRPNIKIGFPAVNYSQDAGVKQMFTPTGTVIAGVNLPVTLTIKNYAVDSLKKVTIAWKLDGVLQTPSYTWNGVLLQDVVSSTINIGNANVIPGPHTIKAWTELPNDSADQNHANDTASISFYACNEILHGTYTIGSSGADFPTFAAALTALQNCGISAPVVFNVQSGIYNEQISFPEITGASATNTITFQSLTGNNNDVTVQFVTTSANNYIIKLNGADNFRFKNMTLQTKGVEYNHVIEMLGNAINNQFDGNKLIGKDTTLTTTDNALVYSGAGLDSLSVFNNNTFTNGTYGMYFYGVGTTSLENKTTITNNTFTNQYYRGIYLGYHNAPLISGNTITTNTTSTAFYGIYAYYCDNNLRILKNKIVIPNSGYGIYIYYSDGASGKEGLTANNAISIGGTNTSYGIYDNYSTYQNIYYNSVNVFANYSTARAMFITGSATYLNHKFKNNIFAYTGANASGVAFYVGYPAQVSGSNYNDLFSTGTNLGYWTALRANLTDWKNNSLRDTNSISVNPAFLSATDLHTMISELNAHATPLANVTDDIQGNPRNATTPDIGAYEFNLPAINIAVVSLVQPAMACSHTANENVVVRIKNVGANPISTVELYYTMNNGPLVHGTSTVTIQPDSSYNYTFAQQVNMSAVDNYYFDIYAHVTGDTIPQNDTINNIMVASGFNFTYGNYSMGFEANENTSLWSKLDVDADTKTWEFPYNGTAHLGVNSARITDNTTGGTADDWLFSRCLSLEAGKRYKIEFWYKVSSATYPQTITLKYGMAATPAGMTNLLNTLTLASNTVYQKASVQFVAPSTGSYYFGWWASSPVYSSLSYAYLDDINVSLMPDFDAALTSITAPVSSCSLTNDEPVTVKIKNTGAQIINTTELYYVLNNGTPVHETLNNPISPDSTVTYTFTQHANFSVLGSYTLKTYIDVAGDTIHANDTINSNFSNGHNFTNGAYTMGFETTDDMSVWSKLDVNADARTWEFPYSSTTYSRTGSYCARFYNGTTNPGNDWMFSRCFNFTAGNTYKIEYWYRVESATYPESVDLKVGTAATPAAMTTTLVSMPSFTNTTYQKATATFAPSTTGTYYFGWYAYSPAANWYAFIDDINISWIPNQEATLLSIVSPVSGCGLSNAEPVSVQIKNTGADTIQGNLTGYYIFNNGTTVSQAITNTIYPGDTTDFTFTQTVDASVVNNDVIFPLKAWVSLIGDPNQTNDTLNKTINSQHIPAPPVTINDTVTFGTPATLHAIAADSVYWYTVPTGGNSIASGHTFTTPNLFNMGIYYAEARTGGGTAISETFDDVSLPANWTAVNGSEVIVDINLDNAAGGNPNEAYFDCLDASTTNNTTSRLYYGPVNTSGSTSLTLQWDNFLDHYSVSYPYSVSVQTSTDHVTWHNTSWVNNPVTAEIGPGLQTVTINTADVGSSTFYLSFTLTGNAFGCMYWYIDNFSLSGGMGGCASARVPDTAFLELYPKEASLDSLVSPVDGCSDGIEDVSILLSNNGLDTLVGNVYVKYTVNGSTAVSELITLPDSIFPGNTIPYTFATPLTTGLSQANVDSTYNIVAWVELAGDPYPANDTVWYSIDLSYTPPAPVVVNYTIPYATTVTMHAVSADSISWYGVPTGGTALSNTHSFTTPILYNTTVYYVEAVSGSVSQHVGPLDNTIGAGGTAGYDYYLKFDVLSPSVNLTGVHVYPASTGDVVFYIANSAGTVLTTITYPVTTPNVKTYIPVNYTLPAGTNYRIGFNSTSTGVDLYRNTAGAVYPYTLPGIISITGNSFSGYPQYYYYFYDWEVGSGGSGCTSERLADTVFVTGVPACDVSVQEIYEPNTGIELSTTETVKVKIKNFGTAPAINFPIHYTVNGGTPVDDIVPGPIASNDTAIFTFAVPANLSVVGTTYNIVAYTTMGCDATLINDTAFKTLQNNPLVYCISTSTSITAYEDIGNVTLSNINNGIATPVTNNSTAINGYTDFTVSLPAIQLNAANTYPISVSIISATSFYSTYVKAFIDYNRDGVINPVSELVLGALATSASPTVSGSFTVPVTAITGLPLRMRVVAEETTVAANVEPCGTYLWGETEDYTVMISPQIPHDAGAIAIIQPLAVQTEGESLPVRVIVKNFGSDTIHNSSNMMVAYSYNGGAPQSITWNGGDILPLATDTAVLPNITITPNVNSICAWTELAGDTYAFNDTVCKTFNATPLYDAGITAFLTPQALLVSGANESVQVIFKNFGADTLTSLDLKYTINGVVMATQPWTGALLPYMTDTVTFTQTFTVPDLTFDLCAYTSLVADANHTNDTLCISPNGAITSTLPYYDDFDGVDVYWTPVTEDDTKWELGMPGYGVTNTVHSAPNAWDINLDTSYNTNAEAMLYTQYFDFTTAVNAKMHFWINYYVENSWDGTRIDYTIDSGASWNVLGIQNDPRGTYWYNDNTITSSGKPGWTSNSLGWKYCEYKLDTLNLASLVRFRFVFTSDGSGQYDGVSVDDFAITLPYPKDAGVQVIKTPTVQGPAGTSATVKARIKNFGSDTLFSIPVSYRIGLTGTPTTQTWTGTLAPEDTTTVTFATALIIPTGAFDLYSYTGLVPDGDHFNDTAVNHITGVPKFDVPYSDNFEGVVTWSGTGTSNLWEWGVPAAAIIDSAYSPTHAWVTNLDGDYTNNATEYLYSPYFLFTGVDSAYLEFWHWYETEAGYDGGRIEYSLNGSTWTILGTQADPNAINWYNATISSYPCWSGSSNGYVYSKFRLTTIPAIVNATTPVQFRFKFFSESSGVDEGWAVDNFAITAPPIPQDAGVTAILQPSAATMTGSPVTVQVTIKNYGTSNLTTIPVRYVVNGGAVTTETWTGGPLVPGATFNYTFTTPFNSPGSTYELCAFTKVTGDIYTFNDTTCASFGTTPAPHDLGISAILSPGLTTIYNHADTVKVRIKNYGYGTETSIPLVFLRNSVQVGAGVWTGTLNGGDSVDYTFTTLNVSPLGNYSLCAKTTLVGDANATNDQICIYAYGQVGIETYDYSAFLLMQNTPNPATNNTNIVFYLPESENVRFEMYDVLGKAVRAEDIDAVRGENQIDLDAATLNEGVYFYSIEYKGEKQTKRMVVVK